MHQGHTRKTTDFKNKVLEERYEECNHRADRQEQEHFVEKEIKPLHLLAFLNS